MFHFISWSDDNSRDQCNFIQNPPILLLYMNNNKKTFINPIVGKFAIDLQIDDSSLHSSTAGGDHTGADDKISLDAAFSDTAHIKNER